MTPAEKALAELARLKGQRQGLGRTILAVDPGTAATGIAMLKDGAPQVIRVVRVAGQSAEDRLPAMCREVARTVRDWLTRGVDTLAIEWQAIRPGDPRPNDILNCAMVLGSVLAVDRSSKVELLSPLPVQWKGTVDADIFTKRILHHFPMAVDHMHDVPAHLKHNGYDALGLAAWAIRKALPWQN